jgi:hypothetical protein
MKWWINGDTRFGCTDRGTLEKLVKMNDEGVDAFKSALPVALREGAATAMQRGEQVYVVDDSFPGVVKVLRKRDAVEYWTIANAVSKSRLPPPKGSVEILSFRLVPWANPQGHVLKEVLVDWRNVGDTPVRAVSADVLGYDAQGNRIQAIADYTIFTVFDDRDRGIPPGAAYKEPEGEGMKLFPETARVEVRIADVFELSGMDSEYDESEAEFRARIEEAKEEAANDA